MCSTPQQKVRDLVRTAQRNSTEHNRSQDQHRYFHIDAFTEGYGCAS